MLNLSITIYFCTIIIYLMILKFPSNNSESIVEKMMVNVNLWQSMRWSWRHPFFVEIIVYHNRSSSRGNALLRAFVTKMEKFCWYQLIVGYVIQSYVERLITQKSMQFHPDAYKSIVENMGNSTQIKTVGRWSYLTKYLFGSDKHVLQYCNGVKAIE